MDGCKGLGLKARHLKGRCVSAVIYGM